MNIFTKVSPGSKINFVEKIDDTHFRIKTTANPQKGKANQSVIKLLSKYLDLPQSHILLTKGEKSHQKTFKIINIQPKS